MIRIELDEKTYDCEEVIKALSDQVRPERLQRIQKVVEGRSRNLIPVMENLYDRGNVSAVMRSAEAFGFYEFHQVTLSDEFKESKRVTQGADKWLLQKEWTNTKESVESLKSRGYKIMVTHLEGGTPMTDISFDQPVALFFGNERDGASPELTELADQRLFIPMQGFVQSFNISVAAALCFQHIRREMERNGLPPLPYEERQRLLALYLFRSCRSPMLPPNLDTH